MNIFISLVLLLVPIKTESGRFTIYQDGRRIGTEEFSISQRPGGYVAEGRTQVNNQDIRSRMELDEQLRVTFYEYQQRGNVVRLKVERPISELEYTIDGKSQTHEVNFPSDGVIIDDNFFHHYLILLYRSGITAVSVPTFVPQQMTLGALTVRSTGNRTFEIESGNLKMLTTTDADGRMIRLSVPDAKVVVER